jgi:hypothetical protein
MRLQVVNAVRQQSAGTFDLAPGAVRERFAGYVTSVGLV